MKTVVSRCGSYRVAVVKNAHGMVEILYVVGREAVRNSLGGCTALRRRLYGGWEGEPWPWLWSYPLPPRPHLRAGGFHCNFAAAAAKLANTVVDAALLFSRSARTPGVVFEGCVQPR